MREIVLFIAQSTFIILLLFGGSRVHAQSGSIDATFNSAGIAFYGDGTASSGIIHTTSVQADNKIIIAGTFTFYHGVARNRIARINADGSLDNTFDPGEGLVNLATTTVVNSTAIQTDGKILVGGSFTLYDGAPRSSIARINIDGSLDLDFNVGTAFAGSTVRSIAIQSDGKILVGGDFTQYNGTACNRIVRLNSDGSLDTNFNIGTGFNSEVRSLAIQADGKIIVGGSFSTFNSTVRSRIARLNANGTLDTSFSPASGFELSSIVNTVALQQDGKIIAGGGFSSYNGVQRNRIARINADGSLDASFNPGSGFNGSVFSIAIQADGKVIAGGQFTSFNGANCNRIVRLNANGSLDSSLNIGSGFNNRVFSIQLIANDKIIAGGEFTTYADSAANRIARLNANGGFDSNFNPVIGFNGAVRVLALQSDGKILSGGLFTSYSGTLNNRIIRLNPDGSQDNSFVVGSGANGSVNTIIELSNGKILIGGLFSTYNNVAAGRIVQLNENGTRDNSFNLGTGANGSIETIAIQGDGKILIGGQFTTFNGTSINRIARLNPDGSLDASFSVGTGANNAINAIVVQADGKILIGGQFTSFNGLSKNHITRLNADGSTDNTFNVGLGASSSIETIALQADGKMLIGGWFTSYNSIPRNRIARLNIDGSLDLEFNAGEGVSTNIETVALQGNGKILIGGAFTNYNGIPCNNIARLNPNGDLDASFNIGSGFNNNVSNCILQTDGKILVGGWFNAFNGITRNRIVRLIGGESCQPTITDLNATIAQGQSYIFDNQNLTTAGTYFATYQNAAGCDSNVTLNLSVVPALEYELLANNNQICAGDPDGVNLSVNIIAGASYPVGYVHCNPTNPTAIVDVTNPATGKTWMDRNLGANHAAISSTDAQGYGSLFQWGRFADGHQCVNRFSGDGVTTSTNTVLGATVTTDTPPHGNYILINSGNFDWRSPQNNNLWQGVSGINNPCPIGYRIPTEAELNTERLSWVTPPINSTNSALGAFSSPLKLPMPGFRSRSVGLLLNVGGFGYYWSSTVNGTSSRRLSFNVNNASIDDNGRANGYSIRCIKN